MVTSLYQPHAMWLLRMYVCTVESHKGHLSIKDELRDHGNTILPLKQDNLSITVK